MNLGDATTLAFIGDVMTLVGVVVAVVTIFVAFISTRWQRDLDTLMQLTNLLTAWYGDLVDIIDYPSDDDPQSLDRFRQKLTYEGPLVIIIARLNARKKYVLFGKKYREVIQTSIGFARTATLAKRYSANDPRAQDRNRAYKTAMTAIRDRVGVAAILIGIHEPMPFEDV